MVGYQKERTWFKGRPLDGIDEISDLDSRFDLADGEGEGPPLAEGPLERERERERIPISSTVCPFSSTCRLGVFERRGGSLESVGGESPVLFVLIYEIKVLDEPRGRTSPGAGTGVFGVGDDVVDTLFTDAEE